MNGRALSKYSYPLKNNVINLIEYRETFQRPYLTKQVSSTDENGYFSFTCKTRNKSNIFYVVELKSDSGYATVHSLEKGKHNDIKFIIGQ